MKILLLGAVHTSSAETAHETTEHTVLARSTVYPLLLLEGIYKLSNDLTA